MAMVIDLYYNVDRGYLSDAYGEQLPASERPRIALSQRPVLALHCIHDNGTTVAFATNDTFSWAADIDFSGDDGPLMLTGNDGVNVAGDWAEADPTAGRLAIRANADSAALQTALGDADELTAYGELKVYAAGETTPYFIGRMALVLANLVDHTGVHPPTVPTNYYTRDQVDALVAGLEEHAASEVDNDSGVTGASVADALDALDADKAEAGHNHDGEYAALVHAHDDTYAGRLHAAMHGEGGQDALKLDDLATPDDSTDLDASTSAHGLLPKLSGDAGDFLDGSGNWSAPTGLSDELVTVSANDSTPGRLAAKLITGAGLAKTEIDDGGNETLSLAVDVDALAADAAPDGAADYVLTHDASAGGLKKVLLDDLPAAVADTNAIKVDRFRAGEFNYPTSNFAPLDRDTGTGFIYRQRFDDTTEEYVYFDIWMPADLDTSGTVTFRAIGAAVTAASGKYINLRLGHMRVGDSGTWDSSYYNEDRGDFQTDPDQDHRDTVEWTRTVSALSWGAGELIRCRLSRIPPTANNLVGDWGLFQFHIEIPRA